MKLLSKNQIDSQKALEQKRAIDEGMKLAKKVDRLREVSAEEEASLNEFRIKTLSQINSEILAITIIRDSLKGEVQKLEQDREAALIPLSKEMDELTEKQRLLEEKERTLLETENRIAHLENESSIREREIRDDAERVELLMRQAKEAARSAHADNDTAQKVLAEATKTDEAVSKRLVELEDEKRRWADHVASTEKRHLDRDSVQDKREVALNKRETALADKEATLLRNIKRNKS